MRAYDDAVKQEIAAIQERANQQIAALLATTTNGAPHTIVARLSLRWPTTAYVNRSALEQWTHPHAVMTRASQ
jgi:hypothetical protein